MFFLFISFHTILGCPVLSHYSCANRLQRVNATMNERGLWNLEKRMLIYLVSVVIMSAMGSMLKYIRIWIWIFARLGVHEFEISTFPKVLSIHCQSSQNDVIYQVHDTSPWGMCSGQPDEHLSGQPILGVCGCDLYDRPYMKSIGSPRWEPMCDKSPQCGELRVY